MYNDEWYCCAITDNCPLGKMNYRLLLLFCITLLVFFSSCREEKTTNFNESTCPTGDLVALQTYLGNPSNATKDVNNPNNYLMEMDEYTISYSRARAIPNWVSWYINDEWIKSNASRQNDFRPNPFMPSDWLVPDEDSYKNSGFDRGHNCPSADRLCSANFNSATFLMSNMIPQAPNQNQETWRLWECYFRYLVKQGNELYIVMGNYGQGGTGFFGYKEKIKDGDLEIVVPESIWKVAIAIPKNDGDDIQAINSNSTVIAINIPNTQAVSSLAWNDAQFITTVDDIEAKMGAGFDLFSNLPENVETVLENKIHTVPAGFSPCQ